MAASFPAIPKDIPRWMYEAFRRLQIKAVETSTGLAAVGRGEVPDGSGTPLPGPDLSQFFYLPGRVGGQIGYGGINSGDDLFLGSTAHSGKGSISLGDILLINEGSGYVGINYLTPTVALDVQGTENSSGSSMVPTSDISAAWAPDATHYYTSLGGASTAGSHFTALALDDGSASFVAIVDSPVPNGSNPEKLGLGGVIVPGETYTVTAKVFTLSGTIPAGTRNLLIYLVDSAGDQWQASTPNQSVVGVTTTASTFTFTITCSGSPVSSGNTANAVWLSASAGDYYVCVSYVAITTAREEIQRWRDADGTIRSGIVAAGAYYLTAGAGAGYFLQSDANGVGAWFNLFGTANTFTAKQTFSGDIDLSTADIITDTSTGTKIGTATGQKLGVWNTAPNIQPTTAITAASFTANTSGIADDSATFDGYTIGQVVAALRRIGLLA